MALRTKLVDVGFQPIPSLDPAHFLHRDRVGYLLLVQTKKRLCYQLHTVNAHRCLETARNAVFGYYVDRAVDLKEALEDSQIDDWAVYFRPDGLYPGLAQTLEQLLRRYRSLNTRRSLLDPEEDTWGYTVYYGKYKRGFTITAPRQQTDEDLIADFLHKWRNALDAALNRGSIDLTTYYVGCGQVGEASRQWIDNKLSGFSILSTTASGPGKRKDVVDHAALNNHRFSTEYRQSLLARA